MITQRKGPECVCVCHACMHYHHIFLYVNYKFSLHEISFRRNVFNLLLRIVGKQLSQPSTQLWALRIDASRHVEQVIEILQQTLALLVFGWEQ